MQRMLVLVPETTTRFIETQITNKSLTNILWNILLSILLGLTGHSDFIHPRLVTLFVTLFVVCLAVCYLVPTPPKLNSGCKVGTNGSSGNRESKTISTYASTNSATMVQSPQCFHCC